MYQKNIHKYSLALLTVMGMGLASCSDEVATSDNAVVLKAQAMQASGQVVNAAWTAGSKVAVLADGKSYVYTLAADGTMTASGNALAWDGKEFAIKAWTPYTDQAISLTDQTNADKLAACDLFACDATVASRYSFCLFDHRMTRMSWDLREVDDSYDEQQIRDARICFLGYGSVNFTNGEVITTGTPDREISTFEAINGKVRSGEAIMAPADMWGKPLIKIEIGGDEYIYTPDRSDDADVASDAGDMVAGSWQKYHISIVRRALTVAMETDDAEWNHVHEFSDNEIADAKLGVIIPSDIAAKPGYVASGIGNGYILDREQGFSISYTEEGFGGLSWTGNCHVTRTETPASGNATTHTYTFSNVKSDITLSYLDGVEEGDYLYDNGAWGKDKQREACTAIGRVFRVGRDINDDSSYGLCKVRGYVVPLQAGNTTEMQWFTNQADAKYIQALADIPVDTDPAVRESYYGGHRLTSLIDTALAPYAADWAEEAPFWHAFKNNGMQAPSATSGWYIPTYAQLKDLCRSDMYDGFAGVYWSSQVYPGTGNVAVGGVEDGDKNTLWAIRCSADQTVGYGWVIDRAKLITVLTF